MRQKYSIAQALRLTAQKYPDLPTLSPQAFYDWLYADNTPERRKFRALMVRPRTRRQPRAKADCGRGRIAGMTPISQRSVEADDRTEFGHWEGDLVVGKNVKTAVATLVERMTRFTLHLRIDTRRSRDVVPAVTRRMRREFVRSITWDQGKEMSDHADLARDLGIRVYFADAHSPWQRGTNENSNGISRRHLPKGTVLDHTPSQLHHISRLMNNRPMPVLSWQSPKEAYATQLEYALRG